MSFSENTGTECMSDSDRELISAAVRHIESAVSDTLSGILTEDSCTQAREVCKQLESALERSGFSTEAKVAHRLGGIFNSKDSASAADLVVLSESIVEVARTLLPPEEPEIVDPGTTSDVESTSADEPDHLPIMEISIASVTDGNAPQKVADIEIQPEKPEYEKPHVIGDSSGQIEWLIDPTAEPPTDIAPVVEPIQELSQAHAELQPDTTEGDQRHLSESSSDKSAEKRQNVVQFQRTDLQASVDPNVSDIEDKDGSMLPERSQSQEGRQRPISISAGSIKPEPKKPQTVVILSFDKEFVSRVAFSSDPGVCTRWVESPTEAVHLMSEDTEALLLIDIGDSPDQGGEFSVRSVVGYLDRVIVVGSDFTREEHEALKSMKVKAVLEKSAADVHFITADPADPDVTFGIGA